MFFLILLFAFASGFASLLYQVLWARELALILGSTVHAISTVLAAFMGGLGIGSIVFGRLVDRSQWRTSRLYAVLECAVAISAIALDVGFRFFPRLYGAAYNFHTGPEVFYTFRFVFAFSCLVVPTLFMGATIPVLAKLVVRESDFGMSAGWLYGFNTIGAAFGAFTGGFFLLERLGMHGTLEVAIAINLLISAVAAVCDGALHPVSKPVPQSGLSARGRLFTGKSPVLIYAFSGFVALGLEVVWSRTLVFSIGATTYAFSSVLVVVLVGLGIGSLGANIVLASAWDPIRWIRVCLAIIAILALTSVWIFTSVSVPIREWLSFSDELSWWRQLLIQFAQTASLLFLPTVFLGAIFPLAAEAQLRDSTVGSGLGRLLAANTFASIGGALLTGFVFIPYLGIPRTYALLATVIVVPFLYLLKKSIWTVGPVVLGWLVLLVMLPNRGALEPVMSTEKLLFYKEGANGTISVVEDYSGDRNLLIDHIAVAGTDPIFMTDQKSLAHLPMQLNPDAKTVLTVGFGSGGASYSFTRYPQLEAIDAVEIDSVVLDASPLFQATNGNPFADPRFRIIRDDARTYLLYGEGRYDIITTDCTDLRYKSNALLYTKEFFEAAKHKLKPNGLVVAWVPLGGLSSADLKMTIRTFTTTFSQVSGWYMYNYPTHYVLLVGSEGDQHFDLNRVREQISIPSVHQDLAEINLDDPLKLLACYFKNRVELIAFSEGASLNTDDAPHLEFSVPKSPHTSSLSDNLEEFLRDVDDPIHLVSTPVDLSALVRARPLIVQGHTIYNSPTEKYNAAIDLYRRAEALNPEDGSLKTLILSVERTAAERKREYEKLSSQNPLDVNAINELGLLRQNERDLDGAQQAFERAIQLAPATVRLHLNLARLFDDKNQFAKSISEYLVALRLDSENWEAWNNLGYVHMEQENYPDAIAAFEKTVVLKPNKYTSWLNLGLAAYRSGRLDRAREAYDRALVLDPDSAEVHLNRAILRLMDKDVDGARTDLLAALAHRPDYAEAHYNLGIIEEQRRDLVQAAFHYRRATEIDPKYVLAYNNLGVLYSVAGQSRLALDTYMKAIVVAPDDAQLRNNLAMEHARLGDFNEAIAQYEKAIQLQPRMFEPYANLAVIYMRRNQMQKAQKYLAEAQRLNPDLKLK